MKLCLASRSLWKAARAKALTSSAFAVKQQDGDEADRGTAAGAGSTVSTQEMSTELDNIDSLVTAL